MWRANARRAPAIASVPPAKRSRDCAPAHVRVLRELYALHSAGSGPSRYHYGGSDRTIDLAGVGRGLWSVLDEAADVGLQVVHARKRFGTVDRYSSAELCLDVTAGTAAEALEIAHELKVVAFDKTGTLTEGRPELVACEAVDGDTDLAVDQK